MTSRSFTLSYTHKHPLCGHYAPPLHETRGNADKFSPPSQRIFSARSASANPPHSPAMRPVCLLDRTKNLHQSDGLHFTSASLPIILRPSGLISWVFMVNLSDVCSAAAQSGTICFSARFLRLHHHSGMLYICPPALHENCQSFCALQA